MLLTHKHLSQCLPPNAGSQLIPSSSLSRLRHLTGCRFLPEGVVSISGMATPPSQRAPPPTARLPPASSFCQPSLVSGMEGTGFFPLLLCDMPDEDGHVLSVAEVGEAPIMGNTWSTLPLPWLMILGVVFEGIWACSSRLHVVEAVFCCSSFCLPYARSFFKPLCTPASGPV